MIETATDTRTRDAIRTAHAERGQALHDVLNWIFHRKPRS